MENARLPEKLRQEIASARAGIAANYTRLWRDEQPTDQAQPQHGSGDQAPPESAPRQTDDR